MSAIEWAKNQAYQEGYKDARVEARVDLADAYVLLDSWRPIGWRDHACRECGESPINLKVFKCAYHRAREAFIEKGKAALK